MIGKKTKKKHIRKPHNSTLVVGEGSDMQINPETYEQWQVDACDKDMWKHGRVSNAYRDGMHLEKGPTGYDSVVWD